MSLQILSSSIHYSHIANEAYIRIAPTSPLQEGNIIAFTEQVGPHLFKVVGKISFIADTQYSAITTEGVQICVHAYLEDVTYKTIKKGA